MVPALPSLSLLCGYRAERDRLWAPSIGVTGDCHKYFSFLAWKKEARQAGSALGPVPYLLESRGYLDSLWSNENPATQLFFRAFVSWNATVLSVPPPPPAWRAHQYQNPWLDLVSPFGGPSPFLSFLSFNFVSFARIWLISLPKPGNKGTASSHPRWGV